MSSSLQYILPMCLIVSAITDIRVHRIPNWISIVLFFGYLLFAISSGAAVSDIAFHYGIGIAVLVAGFVLFALNTIGGGDAKLLAAASVWMGGAAVLPFLLYTTLIGGLFSLIVLQFRRIPLPDAVSDIQWVSRMHKAGTGIPYGVAIATGGILTLMLTESHQYTIY